MVTVPNIRLRSIYPSVRILFSIVVVLPVNPLWLPTAMAPFVKVFPDISVLVVLDISELPSVLMFRANSVTAATWYVRKELFVIL